jgi:hypothetical protein
MLRKLLLFAGGVLFACGTSAWAAPVNYTELSGFGPGSAGLPTTNSPGAFGLGAGSGATYINNYSTLAQPVPGNNFKSFGSFFFGPLNTAGGGVSPIVNTQLIGVFAFQGTTGGTALSPTAVFNQGLMLFLAVPNGTGGSNFTTNNFATWGLTTAGTPAPGVTVVGAYVLKNPGPGSTPTGPAIETVTQGNPGAYTSNKNNTSASQVNSAGVPFGSSNNFTGAALFRDQGTFTGSTFNPVADVFAQNPGANAASYGRTTNGTGAGSSFLPGIVADFTDTFQSTSANPNFDITTNANNLTIANNFFAVSATDPGLLVPDGTSPLLPGTNLLLDGGIGFASGFNNGLATGYNPNFNTGTNTTATGDFPTSTTAANNVAPTIEPFTATTPTTTGTFIPEIDPGSIAGALTLLGGGLLLLKEKRRRKS